VNSTSLLVARSDKVESSDEGDDGEEHGHQRYYGVGRDLMHGGDGKHESEDGNAEKGQKKRPQDDLDVIAGLRAKGHGLCVKQRSLLTHLFLINCVEKAPKLREKNKKKQKTKNKQTKKRNSIYNIYNIYLSKIK